MSENPENNNVETEAPVFCVKCGAKIEKDQAFCPSCGHKVGEKLNTSSQGTGGITGLLNSSKNNIGLIAGIIAVAIILTVVLIVAVIGKQAQGITLNKSSITVKVGETSELSFVINPEDTKNKTVTWSSSNESIATVVSGKITGKNEGDCIITVSTKNGKTDTCEIVVIPAGPDFNSLYDTFCKSSFAKVASDGTYLYVDTNMYDKDDEFDYEAYMAIQNINEELGLPESVNKRMDETRSMDGIQTYEGDGFEISWTYHPDKGMEVTYSLK